MFRQFTGSVQELKADALVLGVFEGDCVVKGAAVELGAVLAEAVRSLCENQEFTGKLNETAVMFPAGLGVRKVVLAGLGKADVFTPERIRQAAGSAVRVAAKGKTRSVAIMMPPSALDTSAWVQAVTEGALLSVYRYEHLKSEAKTPALEEILLSGLVQSEQDAAELALRRGAVMAEATCMARDMVNAPGNMMTPTDMAAVAAKVAVESGLTCEILEESDMKRLGMGALLGVSQGSAQPAKLIVLRYSTENAPETLALVGKGLTFDSGGISLKPGEGMHLMKNDMSGGAAVIGAMAAIGKLKPARNVLGIVACSENLPSGTALKPGDVIKAMNGKTIEILNTDAEGRLILADAVAYAAHLGADRIVDAATLTGACGVALGPNVYSAIVANDDALVADIKAAAALTGERYWQMPGDDDYKELIKSSVADLQNTGGRLGGVMTGGLFIGEFADRKPWAHLDIAPTSFTDKEKHYQPKGGTGVAVRTLAELACRQ